MKLVLWSKRHKGETGPSCNNNAVSEVSLWTINFIDGSGYWRRGYLAKSNVNSLNVDCSLSVQSNFTFFFQQLSDLILCAKL